jgi:hypothetical protein
VRCPFHTRVCTNAITHMQSHKLIIHTILLTWLFRRHQISEVIAKISETRSIIPIQEN